MFDRLTLHVNRETKKVQIFSSFISTKEANVLHHINLSVVFPEGNPNLPR